MRISFARMRFFILFISTFLGSVVIAQQTNDQAFQLSINKVTTTIKIDGKLEESVWQKANMIGNFTQNFPFDTSYAALQTSVAVSYDDNFLYIAAICYQPKKYIVQGLRRDYPNGTSDIFFMGIDPFKDKLNGFYFAVSPYDVQKEGLIFNGNDLSLDWDNKWYCETQQYEDKYTVEVAIPFKTLRYKSDSREWNINFARNNLLMNERSSWAPVGRNFKLYDLNFCGRLNWDAPPPVPGSNISIIPYLSGASNKDFINNTPTNSETQVGFDAKVAITPSLNLDLTVNSDFAQVEVDRQVTNLSRFELFFPERRQFFLENSDLFGSFGFDNINPFFSRRIGLGSNVNNGQNVKVPIIAGARLSGRINKDWRIGFLNMQTAKSEAFGLPATNFTTAAVQRRVGIRNNIGLIFVNKDELNNKNSPTKFNRVIGVDYNMASNDGKWQGKLFYHRMFRPENIDQQYASAGSISYNAPTLNVDFGVENIGINYKADVGFVPRTGYLRNSATLNYVFFPKGKISKWMNTWRIGPDYDIIYGQSNKLITDWDAGIFFRVAFQNSAEIFGALARMDYTYLFSPFDPTNTGGQQLAAGQAYQYFSNRLGFNSNQRRNFFVNINTRFGQYFNGTINQIQTTWNYRWQPWGVISATINYTGIRLPYPFNNADLWVIGPRAELAFNKSVFFNLFLQYNNQVNNLNINARFQWRFKPVSDFFIVYTDNYFANDDINTIVNNRSVKAFQVKNRAIVAKLTYWFNL
ncbi:MAG: carbohydrate binding family 9 domain-containing protein [Chitinophagaceae bacterium]|nr:carbohydrate binding family 9 domain-containing protein [Chitinophagaceae bacterium]